jgi:FeS assembly SUF system protein
MATEKEIWEKLRLVYDPEIPVDIADLGLIYSCRLEGSRVAIRMTLTAPACPVGDYLVTEVRRRVMEVPGVDDVSVELVFEPPWDRSMMSEAAKLALGV